MIHLVLQNSQNQNQSTAKIFFAEKLWGTFAVQKFLTIFQQKMAVFYMYVLGLKIWSYSSQTCSCCHFY